MFLGMLQDFAEGAIPEELIANSVKDYHVKNFDYICLFRAPHLTVKLYFFDDIISSMAEVVNPHDHRYAFTTLVVRGAFTDMTFAESAKGEVFQKFAYLTPLLGGDGFTWKAETRLAMKDQVTVAAGHMLTHAAQDYHTIRIDQPDTVLCLLQFSDVVPVGVPTTTFTKDKEPISLSGLYNKFNYDQIMARLKSIGLK